MKTVRFELGQGFREYICSDDFDQSGEYVKAELVNDLVRAIMNHLLRRPSPDTRDTLLAALEAIGCPADEWS